jgi:uroporphyrinogen-III synthase
VKADRLRGLRVAVTRARPQAEELAAPLRALGADVLLAPLIRVVPADTAEAGAAIARAAPFDWVVFTSANGVELFAQASARAGISLAGTKVACVGPTTAAAARSQGFEPTLVPGDYTGDAVAEAMVAHHELAGTRILLARASGGGAGLPARLAAAGATISDIHLYHSAADLDGARMLRTAITSEILDVLTFTSGSSIRYFKQAVGDPGRAVVAAIGPVTAEVAREEGLTVGIQGNPNTVEGLIDGIVRHFEGLNQ